VVRWGGWGYLLIKAVVDFLRSFIVFWCFFDIFLVIYVRNKKRKKKIFFCVSSKRCM